MRSTRVLVALATGVASVAGLSTMAHAATPPTIVVLPVFGSPLTVTITTNPDGTLNDVSLSDAANYSANTPSLRKVVFTHTTGDAGKVVVRAKNGSQSTSVRVGTLKNLEGPGSWTGTVFNQGDTESVAFTIGDDGGTPAKPTITLGAITESAGVTNTTSTSMHGDDDEDSWVGARVKFAMGDQVRSLSIVVATENGDDEDNDTSAKLSIGLGPSRIDASKVTIGADQTWNGQDCSGAPLTATFKVNADGSISVSAPTTGVTPGKHGGVVIDFGNNVKLFIAAKVDGTTLERLMVVPMYHCKGTDPKPTTNVSIVPTTDGGGDHGDHKGDHHGHD